MTKRDELLALAERCEKADKGSFALECAIAEAVGALATPPRIEGIRSSPPYGRHRGAQDMTPTLLDLAKRCEQATGPDRELDALIDCAIRFPHLRPARPEDHKEHQRGYPPSKGDIWCPTGFLMAQSYTRSIDAALTLVPEGRAIRREYLPAATWPHRVWIYKDSFMPLDDGSRRPVLGKTEALALCAAALKARAETEARG